MRTNYFALPKFRCPQMPRSFRASLGAALFPALLVLSGCSGMRSIPPEVAVVNLVFENVTFLETTALFSIRIDNENPFPLEVSGASHRIYLNGNYVGKGMDSEGFVVPRLSSVTNDVRVHISNWSLVSNAPSMVEGDVISYRVDSTLYSDSLGFGRRNVSDSGTFDIGKLGKAVQPKKPRH